MTLYGNELATAVADEILVLEEDPTDSKLLALLFSRVGYYVTSFVDRPSFVAAALTRTPAGVILDVNPAAGRGLDVLEEIDAPRYRAPIFVTSIHTDIPTVVDAIKRGAFDFIEKRCDRDSVSCRVEAIATHLNGRRQGKGIGADRLSFAGSELLTARERSVLPRIVSGSSNQAIADALQISRRTVEVHRAHILAKLNAKNTADLVRIVLTPGVTRMRA